MDRNEINKTVAESQMFNETLRSLENKIFPWAEKKEKLFNAFINELSIYTEAAEKMPEQWLNMALSMFASSRTFGNPARLKKYLKGHKDELTPEEAEIIRRGMENPWFFSLFSVEESLGRDIFRIYDYSRDKTLILHSPGVESVYRKGTNLFLCLLLDIGVCHLTYALIIYFTGFTVRDIMFFAGMANDYYKKNLDLALAIYNDPIPYMLLYNYAGMPRVMMTDGDLSEYCAHSLKVAGFSPEDYAGKFSIEKKHGIYRCTLEEKREDGRYVFKGTIYYDRHRKLLLIQAMGLNKYRQIKEILADKYNFPLEPAWHASTTMVIALQEILGIKTPDYYYENLFKEAPDPEKSYLTQQLNALTGELVEKFNTGEEYSPQALAEKYDLPVEAVSDLEAALHGMEKRINTAIKNVSKNFPPPPQP